MFQQIYDDNAESAEIWPGGRAECRIAVRSNMQFLFLLSDYPRLCVKIMRLLLWLMFSAVMRFSAHLRDHVVVWVSRPI